MVSGDPATPEQGWKLHSSATVPSAEEVLRRALPIRQAEDASFCAGDGPATFSPVYMTGYSGVAVALLRLAIPGDLPDLVRPWLLSGRMLLTVTGPEYGKRVDGLVDQRSD